MKRVPQFVVLAALLAGSIAQAQNAANNRVYREGNGWVQTIEGSSAVGRNLKVKTDVGSVTVDGGGPAGTVSYVFKMRANYAGSEDSARRKFDAIRFSASRQGDWTVLTGDCIRRCPNNVSVEIHVNAPRALDLVNVDTGGGSMAVNNIAGKVDANTGGGNMAVDGIGGSVNANSGGGNATIGNIGGNLNVQTGGGAISIGSVGGMLEASTGGGAVRIGNGNKAVVVDTGGGAVQVSRCSEGLHVSTGGGTIDLGDVGGTVVASTGGGSIKVTSAKGGVQAESGGGNLQLMHITDSARAETGAGGITAEFVGPLTKPSLLETNSGDILVYLPAGAKVTIRAAVDMGDRDAIRTEFNDIHITRSGGDYGPGEVYAEGSLNGGGPMLKIRTSIGHIDIRRGK